MLRTGCSGFGPGKVILLGEHAVVYGRAAVAGPLSRGVLARGVPASRCSLALPPSLKGPGRGVLAQAFARAAKACGEPGVRVSLEGDLPVSVGLGSSAAVSVACARVLLAASGRQPTFGRVARVALQMEREFHGTPSGIDHTASAQGRLIYFRRRGGAGALVRPLQSPRPLKLLVALAGERGPTRLWVGALRERVRRWPRRYGRLMDEVGRLADEGAGAIESGDLEALGDVMNVNQGLLSAMQLSSPPIEEMVQRLRSMGALGAKLTGAGGGGGAVIGLFLEPERVVAKLARLGIRCLGSQLGGPVVL
ncbi:MAG: mevalonate kinase [Myxococcales bacterium]|nr:mevalonate kinase [Myxococcales bacterium]